MSSNKPTLDLGDLNEFQQFVDRYESVWTNFNQSIDACKTAQTALAALIASDSKFDIPELRDIKMDQDKKLGELTSFKLQTTALLAQYRAEYNSKVAEASQTPPEPVQPVQPVNSGAFPAVNTITQSSAAIAAKPASRSTGMVGVNVPNSASKLPVAATSNDSREQSPLRQSSAKSSRSNTSRHPTATTQPTQPTQPAQPSSSSSQRKTRATPATQKPPPPKPPPNPMADSDDEFF